MDGNVSLVIVPFSLRVTAKSPAVRNAMPFAIVVRVIRRTSCESSIVVPLVISTAGRLMTARPAPRVLSRYDRNTLLPSGVKYRLSNDSDAARWNRANAFV